jgi:glutathione synthase/RimK-type ligase-like ATP-grasp enzyme
VRAIRLGDGDSYRWRGLVDGFSAWLLESPVPVVNSPHSHVLNSYKPAHYAWLAAQGLNVPASLTSSRGEEVADFLAGGRAVVKPVCGTRATTRELALDRVVGRSDLGGPVLVQRLVEGDDVRAHVIGHEVIACRFSSHHIDYRSDHTATRSVGDIPDDLADRLVALTAAQGLTFAGWDFKVDADETFWALECNPMPGYSFYDRIADGAIAAALVRLLNR